MPASIHSQFLERTVTFFPFPTPAAAPRQVRVTVDKSSLARLFIGQLPFLFTDEQLTHALTVATGGRTAVHIERIVNWKKNRAPTGCAHVFCRPEDQRPILAAHQRILFDEEGVWVAHTAAETAALVQYADHLRTCEAPRPQHGNKMPMGLVSIEEARSTYVRDEAFAVTSFASACATPRLSAASQRRSDSIATSIPAFFSAVPHR